MQGLGDMELFSPSPSQLCESSGSSSPAVYTSQVKKDLIPKIKQQFDSLDDVHQFYNNYARESGFGMRIHSSKKSRDGEIIRKEYVCCKEGVRVQKNIVQNSERTVRKRGLTRVGCGAKLSVVKNRSGAGFVVTQFVEVHNHHLTTPKKVHLLRSHRGVSVVKKALTQRLAAANVPTCQRTSILELQPGGLENVGCLQPDLYNAKRDRREMFEGHDANMLLEHFQVEQQNNPGFMFTFEKDDEGRMTRCFWADATCRKSYQYFGDVVVFNTTYNTNQYASIFAPILGINHHGQATLFGCAFLSDETSDSFEWLFKEWLKAMLASPPKMIITDQDLAMTKAIAIALPNTHHRYCIWHIVSKFSEKIGAVSYEEHCEEFRKCIWNSESPEEFEARWVDVVEKANLSNNEWLHAIYKIRERWVPACMKHIFSAHMTSSQRAEISHSFFKKCVSPHNSLLNFVTRFDRALSHIRDNELDLDYKDVNEKPLLKTMRPMESTMAELYTHNVFYKFQEELFESDAYVVTRTFKDEHRCLYNVQRPKESGSKGREVSLQKSSNYVSCSCKMFECDGIPCRHMFAYFRKKQIMKLPNEYILWRWTKLAKTSRVMDDFGGGVKEICYTSLLVRRNRLFQLAFNVIDDPVLTEDGTQLLEEALLSTQKKFAVKKRGREDGEGSAINSKKATLGGQAAESLLGRRRD